MKRLIFFLPLGVFSLVYSIDSCIQGLTAALALLLFYPPLVIAAMTLGKICNGETAYALLLALSTLIMGLYLHFAGSFDPALVENLGYRVPASMAAGPFILLGFSSFEGPLAAARERRMVTDAFILAFLTAAFAALRDILLHGSLDLRFSQWGALIPMGGKALTSKPRAFSFLVMALILGLLSFFEEKENA